MPSIPLDSPIAPTIPLKGWVSLLTSRSSIVACPFTLFHHVICPSSPILPPIQLRPPSLVLSRRIPMLGNARQPKTSATVLVLHVLCWQRIDISRRFDPADSMQLFCRATLHHAEFATNKFATFHFSGTLIRAAVTSQRFALYCVGSPKTLTELKDQHGDSNALLNPCNDRHGNIIKNSAIQPEIRMTSLK